ncbi:hypothetical protein [Streptomyces sp. NPDC096033]|uniref:hypothetical protein n=1 Tax=Streptomyces sp. NPDC096033 TaxID=3366071 RepID=UPI003808B4CF
MSRTDRTAAAAAVSALLFAGAVTTVSAAVTDGSSTKITAAGPGSIDGDTALMAGAHSFNWD